MKHPAYPIVLIAVFLCGCALTGRRVAKTSSAMLEQEPPTAEVSTTAADPESSPVALASVSQTSAALQSSRMPLAEPTLPSQQVMQRGQLIISSDFALPERHRLIEELVAERSDICEKLALPTSDEPIYVYLFDSEDQFRRYLHNRHPGLPARRAFFLEADTKLSVLAFWGDRVGEDLRHEAAHGYLHSVLPRLPLWLDEGLAENFEVPRGMQGFNQSHVERLYVEMTASRWRPHMSRLEEMTAPNQMRAIDYAESWLWMHLLLETTPPRRQLLRDYLSDLRRHGAAPALWPQLVKAEPDIERRLLEHLQTLVQSTARE